MAETIEMTVNGRRERVVADAKTPLLHVLRNDLGVLGPKFGCGLAQCGACTVDMDGVAIRSCQTPVSSAMGTSITTIEGLAAKDGTLTAVQQAFIDEQAAQCGFCLSGVILTAKAFLDQNPKATDVEIKQALSGVLCRCFTHLRMMKAITRYARSL